jgi:polyphosphate kinase 2 (PPK2 family)
VLIVRVHEFVPRDVWLQRYDQIREFEQVLSQTGTVIVKFFLYINKDEQRQRFQERYDNPKKRWKFSLGDTEERKYWDDYIAAYEDALNKTSTDYAPWYIIPANHNWFRNLAVSSILADTIDELKPAYPPAPDLPKDLVIE